jgi:hypothetical protein
LDHEDFSISNDDINFTNLQMDDDDDEFRARIFSYKWARLLSPKSELKPFTVSPGNEDLDKTWKNYLVLLMGNGGENKLAKVCFPADLEDNFAIVTSFGKSCSFKVNKIKEYRILDDDYAEPERNEKKSKDTEDTEEHNNDNKFTTKAKAQMKKQKSKERKEKYDKIIDNLDNELKHKKRAHQDIQ